MVSSMFQNYVCRDNTAGLSGTDGISENLLISPMLAAALIAGWARPRWLQWGAGLAMFGSCEEGSSALSDENPFRI